MGQLALPDQPVPPPAVPETQMVRAPKGPRRSIGGLCPACDLDTKRVHTYPGRCRGLPRSVYFESRLNKAIADEATPELQ